MSRFRLQIPRLIYEEMVAQAIAESPNECCGLLGGTSDGRVLVRYPLVNAATSPTTEFLSEARSLFLAEKDRRARGVEFLAVYHSHPTSAAEPSRKDRERNYSPDAVNVIVSLAGVEPVVRAWWIGDENVVEAAWVWV